MKKLGSLMLAALIAFALYPVAGIYADSDFEGDWVGKYTIHNINETGINNHVPENISYEVEKSDYVGGYIKISIVAGKDGGLLAEVYDDEGNFIPCRPVKVRGNSITITTKPGYFGYGDEYQVYYEVQGKLSNDNESISGTYYSKFTDNEVEMSGNFEVKKGGGGISGLFDKAGETVSGKGKGLLDTVKGFVSGKGKGLLNSVKGLFKGIGNSIDIAGKEDSDKESDNNKEENRNEDEDNNKEDNNEDGN